jgi:hypothetical protein
MDFFRFGKLGIGLSNLYSDVFISNDESGKDNSQWQKISLLERKPVENCCLFSVSRIGQ